MKYFNKFNQRFWIPYRAAEEYHENLLAEVSKQKEKYENAVEELNNLLEKYDEDRGHPFLSEDVQEDFQELIGKIEKEFDEKKDQLGTLPDDIPYKERLAEIFAGRVGDEYTQEKLEEIYKTGEERYQKKTPPGFKDSHKDQSDKRKYGDLIIWKQMIEKSNEDDCPIIFITDDQKEDWFKEEKGKKIGPHPDLIREFYEETSHEFYIYTFDRFLKWANEYLKADIAEDTIDEISLEEEFRSKMRELAIEIADDETKEKILRIKHMMADKEFIKNCEYEVDNGNVEWTFVAGKDDIEIIEIPYYKNYIKYSSPEEIVSDLTTVVRQQMNLE